VSASPRCPICRKPVAPRAANSAFPFCSDRCRLVDLGKWLGEEYRVPAADTDADRDAAGEDEQPDGEAPLKH
jgi:hypothetical protein